MLALNISETLYKCFNSELSRFYQFLTWPCSKPKSLQLKLRCCFSSASPSNFSSSLACVWVSTVLTPPFFFLITCQKQQNKLFFKLPLLTLCSPNLQKLWQVARKIVLTWFWSNNRKKYRLDTAREIVGRQLFPGSMVRIRHQFCIRKVKRQVIHIVGTNQEDLPNQVQENAPLHSRKLHNFPRARLIPCTTEVTGAPPLWNWQNLLHKFT